jgi:hypothetical protein
MLCPGRAKSRAPAGTPKSQTRLEESRQAPRAPAVASGLGDRAPRGGRVPGGDGPDVLRERAVEGSVWPLARSIRVGARRGLRPRGRRARRPAWCRVGAVRPGGACGAPARRAGGRRGGGEACALRLRAGRVFARGTGVPRSGHSRGANRGRAARDRRLRIRSDLRSCRRDRDGRGARRRVEGRPFAPRPRSTGATQRTRRGTGLAGSAAAASGYGKRGIDCGPRGARDQRVVKSCETYHD